MDASARLLMHVHMPPMLPLTTMELMVLSSVSGSSAFLYGSSAAIAQQKASRRASAPRARPEVCAQHSVWGSAGARTGWRGQGE